MLLAASAGASAADIPKVIYLAEGVVTASTCGKLSPSLAVGTTTLSSVRYPGAGKRDMVFGSPATAKNGKPGSAATNVCTTPALIPAKGLHGATVKFNCFTDAVNALGRTATTLESEFNVGPSHNPGLRSVTISATLLSGGKPLCRFTTGGTYALHSGLGSISRRFQTPLLSKLGACGRPVQAQIFVAICAIRPDFLAAGPAEDGLSKRLYGPSEAEQCEAIKLINGSCA